MRQVTDDVATDRRPAGYRTIALIVASAAFMENLDATVLVTALPSMARAFGTTAETLGVTLTSYLLALAVFIPASGTLADRLGARSAFCTGMGLFIAGSLGCAMAPNLAAIVAARFVQGAGAALMKPVGRLVLIRSVEKRDLVAATAWLIVPAQAGPLLGPPLGGAIVTFLDWRWIFWLNLPVALVGLIMAARFFSDERHTAPHPFDRRGFALSGIALGTIVAGLEAITRHAGTMTVIALVGGGGIAGTAYVRHARRTARPVLDLELLRVPTFRLSMIAGSLSRITQGAQPFLLPLLLQLCFGLSAAHSGLVTVATAVGAFAMRSITGRILRRYGYRTSLIASSLLGSLSYAVCGLFRPDWPLPAIFVVLLLSGFLMSFQFTAYSTMAYDEIDAARMSAATTFYATVQQLTLTLGVGLAAIALSSSVAWQGRAAPTFTDFSIAFWIVTSVSLAAVPVNRRLDPAAGAILSGHDAAKRPAT